MWIAERSRTERAASAERNPPVHRRISGGLRRSRLSTRQPGHPETLVEGEGDAGSEHHDREDQGKRDGGLQPGLHDRRRRVPRVVVDPQESPRRIAGDVLLRPGGPRLRELTPEEQPRTRPLDAVDRVAVGDPGDERRPIPPPGPWDDLRLRDPALDGRPGRTADRQNRLATEADQQHRTEEDEDRGEDLPDGGGDRVEHLREIHTRRLPDAKRATRLPIGVRRLAESAVTSPTATFSARTAAPPPPSRTPAGRRASSRRTSIAPRTTSARGPPAWGAPRTRTRRSIPALPTPAGAST